MTTTFAPETKMHHATRAKAAKLAETLAAEYPKLTLIALPGDETDHETYTHELAGFAVIVDGNEDEPLIETEGKTLPELADIVDAIQEAGLDMEEDEEEEARSGSVVPETYRAQYKAISSNGQTCGDWLAERLVADTAMADGKINIDDFIAILEANSVDMTGKWATARFAQTRGWQGRFRMSGRIVLEKQVVLTGIYHDHTGAKVTPHAEWLAAMEDKHRVWLAKQRKKAEAAEAAIREAVEGTETEE